MTGGIELARRYHEDVVAPLLGVRRPGLRYAAGRLGSGSDVLGLDDATSRDHDWGLRLTLLVEADHVAAVERHLEDGLPDHYAGRPTRFATTWDPTVRQRVEVATAEGFVASRLGLDAAAGLSSVDWLCLTGQSVLEVTAGPVFSDTLGTLTGLRRTLEWYPDDVWRYVVAAGWIRLGEDLPLLGRTGQRGDDLGSRVLCGRLAGTAMHLAFLLSRRWPPYPKWLGTLLTPLPVARDLLPALTSAMSAEHWTGRQAAIAEALAALHEAQRLAGLPTAAGVPTEPFHDRPFLGVRAAVPDLLLAGVTDPLLQALPPGAGSVEQWVDNVRVLTNPGHRLAAARSYVLTRTRSPLG